MRIPLRTSDDLVVEARPITVESSTYQFKIRNVSGVALLEIRLNLYEALAPGDFGLDDTHMSSDLRQEPLVELAFLAPASEVRFTRKRWGPMSKFRGLSTKKLQASFLLPGESSDDAGKHIFFTVWA